MPRIKVTLGVFHIKYVGLNKRKLTRCVGMTRFDLKNQKGDQ